MGLHKYSPTTKDCMTELVRKHKNSEKLYSVKHRRTKRTKPQTSPNKSCKRNETESKSEGLKNLKSTSEKNPFMISTHYEPITLMLTRITSISGFVAQR